MNEICKRQRKGWTGTLSSGGFAHTQTRAHAHMCMAKPTRLINNALDFDLNKLYYERSYFIISTVSRPRPRPDSLSIFPVRFSNDFSFLVGFFFIWRHANPPD